MKKQYSFLLLMSFCVFSLSLSAEETSLLKKWKDLIAFSKLSNETFSKVCPHFNESVESWIANNPSEVKSFLALPEIKKINPSLVDLGLKKEGVEEPRVFGNPFLKWIEGSGVSKSELSAMAPHFPNASITNDIETSEKVFAFALSDWMMIYAKEYETLINSSKLVKTNKYYTGYQKINSPVADSSWRVLAPGKVQPTKDQYNSGNEALDAKRFEQYTRAWYFRYNKVDYFRIYEPEKSAAFLKEKETEENDKGYK